MAKKKSAEERSEAEKAFYEIKRSFTDEDIQNLYNNAIQNIVEPYKRDLDIMPDDKLDEIIDTWNRATQNGNGRGNQAPGRFGRSIQSKKDLKDYLDWWIDFYHNIKTAEQFNSELERFEKLLYVDYQIKMPIIVKFDYQVTAINSFIVNVPTFYSYWDGSLKTNYGEGSFVIAFCSWTPILTDEELMAVIKHEFGHIIQGHCVLPNETFTHQEGEYRNQAMDISINIALTVDEKKLLISAASKMWGEGATGCMSLSGPRDEGGLDLRGRFIAPGNWPKALSELKYAFPPKQKQPGEGQGEGGGGESGGEGGGGGGGGSSIENINVGDYVVTRTFPKKYGKVIYVDPISGRADIEEYTDDEWEQIRKTLK